MCTNLANELGHQQICQESGRPPTMGWTLGPGSAHLAWILSTTSFREGWHDCWRSMEAIGTTKWCAGISTIYWWWWWWLLLLILLLLRFPARNVFFCDFPLPCLITAGGYVFFSLMFKIAPILVHITSNGMYHDYFCTAPPHINIPFDVRWFMFKST